MPNSGICTGDKNWLWWVAEELKRYHEVNINECNDKTDLIICMTDSATGLLKRFNNEYPDKPIITYIWDWFSFVDTTQGNYPEYLGLMNKSKDVWTSTDYMVKRIKDLHGINCHKIKPCSSFPEFENVETKDLGYVVMASRRDPRYKRFELFEKACEELGIPYESCHPNKYSREQYINILAGCRALVVATCEDANTALSAVEASYLKKPLILSDIEPHLEEFGNTAEYFKTDDLEDLKNRIVEIYENTDSPDILYRTKLSNELVMNSHTPATMAKAMADRIKKIC